MGRPESARRRSRRRSGAHVRLTRAGVGYLLVWAGLLAMGLYRQINLIMMIAGLAAGPIAASLLMSLGAFRKVQLVRRVPDQVFAGESLVVEYLLRNERSWNAVLAIDVEDALDPLDRLVPGAVVVRPTVSFDRVGPVRTARVRWSAPAPVRGRYAYRDFDLVSRAPFGLIEQRQRIESPATLLVYPRVGRLTRQWRRLRRESTQTRRGRRHDRTAQQQEYHGLRDYRPGDSQRWIHWRTSARLGTLMVKEFEQEQDQVLALVLDPWLPRSKVTPEQREAVEELIRFAATVCLETCRQTGRRLVVGWTGAPPGMRQGPANARLLHELLDVLTSLPGSPLGQPSDVFDLLAPAVIRDAMVVLASTRSVNMEEEAARSQRLREAAARGLASRLIVLDASRGDLAAFVDYHDRPTSLVSEIGPSHDRAVPSDSLSP